MKLSIGISALLALSLLDLTWAASTHTTCQTAKVSGHGTTTHFLKASTKYKTVTKSVRKVTTKTITSGSRPTSTSIGLVLKTTSVTRAIVTKTQTVTPTTFAVEVPTTTSFAPTVTPTVLVTTTVPGPAVTEYSTSYTAPPGPTLDPPVIVSRDLGPRETGPLSPLIARKSTVTQITSENCEAEKSKLKGTALYCRRIVQANPQTVTKTHTLTATRKVRPAPTTVVSFITATVTKNVWPSKASITVTAATVTSTLTASTLTFVSTPTADPVPSTVTEAGPGPTETVTISQNEYCGNGPRARSFTDLDGIGYHSGSGISLSNTKSATAEECCEFVANVPGAVGWVFYGPTICLYTVSTNCVAGSPGTQGIFNQNGIYLGGQLQCQAYN